MPILTGEDFAEALLSYDRRLRCTCAHHGNRCLHRATGEDMRCDACRRGGHDVSDLSYYVTHIDDLTPERFDEARRRSIGKHLLLCAFGEFADARA